MRQAEITEVLKKCRTSLSKALNNIHIFLSDPINAADNKRVYIFSAHNSTRAKDKYAYTVIPIFNTHDSFFWIGASLEFQYLQGIPKFVGTSIIIFEGEPHDEEKTPLFRAEWEPNFGGHAQPHWHIYTGRMNNQRTQESFDEGLIEFGSDIIIKEPQSGQLWDKGKKFHFAMASKWHQDSEQPTYVELDHQNIQKWLYGCVSYAINQLKWLYGLEASMEL